jgi:hypothetical protein
MTYSIKRTVLAIALVGVVGAANATALVSNVLTANVDTTATFFGGTLLNSAVTNISNFSYSGIARTAVYQTASGLDFYYQFTNNPTSSTGIERFAGYNFSPLGNSAVSVFQTSAAFGVFVAGTEKSDYADRTNLGVLAFSFVPNGASKIDPGTTSYTQIVRTNATAYTEGNFGVIDGFASNAPGFAPAMPVPEPESLAMLLAGLGLMGTIARRRARSNTSESAGS